MTYPHTNEEGGGGRRCDLLLINDVCIGTRRVIIIIRRQTIVRHLVARGYNDDDDDDDSETFRRPAVFVAATPRSPVRGPSSVLHKRRCRRTHYIIIRRSIRRFREKKKIHTYIKPFSSFAARLRTDLARKGDVRASVILYYILRDAHAHVQHTRASWLAEAALAID